MHERAIILDLLLGFLGGCAGAAVGAIGGFVLFGFALTVGYISLFATGNEIWLLAATGTSLLKPSTCFVGGVIAAGFARRHEQLRCGKDIGRALVTLQSPSLLLMGGLAGTGGALLATIIDRLSFGHLDGVTATVVLLPLLLKYLWKLTKSSDCEGTSHAVSSPFRFFERFEKPLWKSLLCLSCALVAALFTIVLSRDARTAPYAALPAFGLSALSLIVLYMRIPIPATHHFSGPAGACVFAWISSRGALPSGPADLGLILLWACVAAALGQYFCDLLGKLIFREGDMHVDPPAMGILVSGTTVTWLLPKAGVYHLSTPLQLLLAACLLFLLSLLNLSPLKRLSPQE